VLALGSFDAQNPTVSGCLAANDDFSLSGPVSAGSRIESDGSSQANNVYILPGETLQVIATTFAANAAIGAYTIDVRTAATNTDPPMAASLPGAGGTLVTSGTLHTIDARWNRPNQCSAPPAGTANHYVDSHFVEEQPRHAAKRADHRHMDRRPQRLPPRLCIHPLRSGEPARPCASRPTTATPRA
jgi:hypothetical protein